MTGRKWKILRESGECDGMVLENDREKEKDTAVLKLLKETDS